MTQADIKDFVARGLLGSGAWRLLAPRRSKRSCCVIVNFHSIVDQDFKGLRKGPSVHTPVETFDQFLDYATRVFEPISLDRLVVHLDEGEPLVRNRIAVTFDDGYENNLRLAAPVLEKYRCPATVFVPVDYIGGGKMLPMDKISAILNQTEHERIVIQSPVELSLRCDSINAKAKSNTLLSTELKKRPAQEWDEIIDHVQARAGLSTLEIENPMLSWEQASELPGKGVSIGSHGCTHRLMTALTPDEAIDELTRSRDTIGDRLGHAPRHFAYPNGRAIDFDETLRREAKNAGYSSVLSCERDITVVGRSKSNTLGRFGLVGKPGHSAIYLIQAAARQLS